MSRLRIYWPIIYRMAFGLLLTLFFYTILYLLRWFFFMARLSLYSDLAFLSIWAGSYFVVAGLIWSRKKLLWSLRNQMAAAYIFIAVVPVLLLSSMAGLSAYLLYWQLGSYVLNSDVQARVQRVATVAGGLATTLANEAVLTGQSTSGALTIPDQTQGFVKSAKADIPGLEIEIGQGEDLLAETGSSEATGFRGIVLSGHTLALRAVQVRAIPGGKVFVSVSASVTPELLDTLSTELGPIRFLVLEPTANADEPGQIASLSGERLDIVQRIATDHRADPPAASIFDKVINGVTTLDLVDLGDDHRPKGRAELHALFVTRASLLNKRLFASLDPRGGTAANLLLIVGAIFLALELAALVIGIVLTRAITTSVDNLYLATRHVQSGDLAFRVPVQQRDELGALGDSFNSMMQSVGALIDEQRERHRLENELAIAREVQNQLFPRELPSVPGVELEAICRPARMVSGDYYDFIRIGPTRLAIVLADISGKGISAALLMASLQATLRGELLRDVDNNSGPEPAFPDTAKIVSHLNRHLFLNTSEERYATLFLAIYDSQMRRLSYTNAGHLPPFYLCGNIMERLETGDTVIGLFDDVKFRQATLTVAPEALLVIYSDGLTEPEDGSGEAFGSGRLAEIAQSLRDKPARVIAQSMISAAELWTSSSDQAPEQADDATVVVARLTPLSLQDSAIEPAAKSAIEN